MKTIFKIFVFVILFLVLCLKSVNASTILMNLEDYSQSNTNTQLENTNENNVENQLDGNLLNENSNTAISQNQNISKVQTRDTDDSPRVSSSTTVSDNDEFLTVENILSIIIIVIGILLIFLAIAILIRFK